ncbi:MAG: DNA polymerase III subunit gamma/tau [Burkholderiales bacterium]|nr:DNA polymerase III subunit gamma/tau [Burkholderiales bacterium]
MTLALARKYRPRTFTEVVGQEHVVRALTNALTQNRLHHAYLLTGTRGVGKTTLARIIAKALNCETGITATPCGVCGACKEIDGGRFIDLIELDAASNTQVDSMRELLENALYAPTSGRFKVYIIDEVHMLSRNAFNAMLKTLEEPPEHVKFILATTDPQKIPVTVLSRCLQFMLKQIPPPVIRAQLEKVLGLEGVPAEPGALNLIARSAQGSMRDALSLLDQAIAHGAGKVEEAAVRDMLGAVDAGYLYTLLEALAARDGPALLAQADALEARGLSFESALQELASLLHRVAVAQTLPETVADDDPERERVLKLARALSPEDVQLFYQIALRGRGDLPLAPDEYAGFTMTLMRMLAFLPASGEGGGARPQSRPAMAAAPTRSTPLRAAEPTPAATPGSPRKLAPEAWPDTVAQLKLGGMARMLAQHCALQSFTDGRMQLIVPEAHKHLLDAAYREKLKAALEERFGPLRLDVSVGQAADGGTLAEREDRERVERQTRATESIERDPFVRDLVENFDARVIDGSIRPLQ